MTTVRKLVLLIPLLFLPPAILCFLVSLSSSATNEPVVLSLATSGSGTAEFADGATSMTITTSTTLTVQGTDASTNANDLALLAKPQNSPGRTLAQQNLSAVTVVLAINHATSCNAPYSPPCLSSDDDSVVPYQAATGTQSTGLYIFGANVIWPGQQTSVPSGVCGIGIEFLGRVTPSNYQGTVNLRRSVAGW